MLPGMRLVSKSGVPIGIFRQCTSWRCGFLSALSVPGI